MHLLHAKFTNVIYKPQYLPSWGDKYNKERDTSRQDLQNILKVKLLFETIN